MAGTGWPALCERVTPMTGDDSDLLIVACDACLDGYARPGRAVAQLTACRCVCGPKISSTSCDQAIFVDQATDASLLPDATLAEVGWLG